MCYHPFTSVISSTKIHSIAHLLCYRYAIANDQRTFATGIRKWSRHLEEFPTQKFTTMDRTQQWLAILTDIYTYLYTMDSTFRSTLINTGHIHSRFSVNHHGDVYQLILTPARTLTLSVIF